MIQGLYAAANGMRAVEDRQAIIANNIANATTPGFKRQIGIQKGYYEEFFGMLKDPQRFDLEKAPGGGVKLIESFTNFSDGILQPTGNAMDVALIGQGFLKLETPDGVRFTRNGRFAVGVEGQIVNLDGNTVLGVGDEPIDVSGGSPIFHADGTVTVNGETRGQLSILEFENPHALTREGYTLYSASQETINQAIPAERTSVAGQSLEMSNVQVPSEVSQMMLALRAYGANQQVISAIDQTASRMIDQIGQPG